MDEKPLVIAMEELKTAIAAPINAGLQNGIPAFLIEQILGGIMSEVRQLKNNELTAAYKQASQKAEKKNGE